MTERMPTNGEYAADIADRVRALEDRIRDLEHGQAEGQRDLSQGIKIGQWLMGGVAGILIAAAGFVGSAWNTQSNAITALQHSVIAMTEQISTLRRDVEAIRSSVHTHDQSSTSR